MNNRTLPPTKKIRLSKISTSTESTLKAISKSNKVFEWSNEKVKILIFGVVRHHISLFIGYVV